MIFLIIRKIASALLVAAIVGVLVFNFIRLAPGDPATIIAGEQATAADIDRIRQQLDLDKPYLVQFKNWSTRILRGDLGMSLLTNLPVSTLVKQRIEPTVWITIYTLLFSVFVGIPTGLWAAVRRGSFIDWAVTFATTAGFSIPTFVVGYILSYFLGLKLGLFPTSGYVPIANGIRGQMTSLVLPVITIGSIYVSLIARTTRAAALEILDNDYIRTARAKGIGTPRILLVHCLRNAAMPIVTVIGSGFAILIGGSVITETVFSIPGLGRLVTDAILRRDYPIIQAMVILFSLVYVALNLMIDIIYICIDPRIRS